MRIGKYIKDPAEPNRKVDGQLALVGHGGCSLPSGGDSEEMARRNRDRDRAAIAARYAQNVKNNPNHVGRPRPKPNPANHRMVFLKTESGGTTK